MFNQLVILRLSVASCCFLTVKIGWNTSTLEQLCTSECESSLSNLGNAVGTNCGSEYFNFGGQNMTYTQLVDFIQYKYGLICLADDTTGEFCSDIEAR